MADTKAEQILQALTTLLETLPGLTVYRSRRDALSRRQAPALVIAQASNTPGTDNNSTCRIDWDLQVDLMFYCRGAIPDGEASPFIAAAHALLMADTSLGGLSMRVWPGPQQAQLDPVDATCAWMVCSYNVRHRTNQNDLST